MIGGLQMFGEWLGFILYGNIVLLLFIYQYLFKRRRLIGFQLGMNISMIVGGMFAITSGVILIYQFPLHFVTVTVISTFIGIIIGSIFGGLFDYQTLLTGYMNGLMMGIMAPMVGAAAKNSFPFLLLLESIFIMSFFLVVSSVKSS